MPIHNTSDDFMLWFAGVGGGDALAFVSGDPLVGGGNTSIGLTYILAGDPNLFAPRDIVLDTVHDTFFFVDSDLAGHNRILQGSISQVLANPGAAVFTTLYQDTGSGANTAIRAIVIDPEHGQVFFDHGTTFDRVNYNTALQTPTVLANLGSGNFITQVAINFATGTVFLGSSRVTTFFGQDAVEDNFIYRATGLTPASASLSFAKIPFSPNDTGFGDPDVPPIGGNAFPQEHGTIRGIDYDPTTNTLYISTATVTLDTSPDQDGSELTTYYGGVFAYALTGNPSGTYTTIFQQDGTNGPVGQLGYIEVDPSTGHYFLVDVTGGPAAGDGGVWIGSLAGGTPTLFSTIGNPGNLSPQGVDLIHAPTLNGVETGASAVETVGPGSGFTAAVQPFASIDASDLDSAAFTDQLAGAQVRISAGFGSAPGSNEQLTIAGTISGTLGSGISYSYNGLTGVMTLSGVNTFDNYEAALALVAYSISGDNPDAGGTAPSRTISFSLFDGLLFSDEFDTTVNVVGTNDGPDNTIGGAVEAIEDSVGVAITGLSVSDADSPGLTVTLSVAHGAIDILDSVGGGLSPGQISGNGTDSVTLTGSQSQINATLAAMGGVTYVPAADYNGADTLTIVTSDGSLSDIDTVSISIGAVADIVNDNAPTDEDNSVGIFVLGNDTFEGSPAITAVGPAAHGGVSINDNGTAGDTTDDYLVYTPDADFNGSDSFTYTVTSGGTSETATVNLTVNAVADIVADMVSIDEDSGANALDLLANDSFEDPGRYISAVTQGAHGSVAINDNGTAGDLTDDYVTYTPDADFAGIDSFTYTVTAGGVTETAIVNVNFTGENDAPVNGTGAAVAATEDASVAVTGLSVTDVDSGMLSVTLSVGRGTLAIDTGVAGGLTAGQVSGNGTASVTVTGTQAAINATLAAATGVVYAPAADLNGADTLTMTSSDGGLSDSDNVAINVGPVNDAPLVVGDGTESAATIDQDAPSVTGQSVASLFAGQFSDATDQVAGGSSANAFAGVAITANGSGASGQWQYFNGAVWVNIGAASTGAAVLLDAATAIRFNPAPGFVGTAATLIAHLVDSSAGAIVSGALADLTVDGGITPYSHSTVTLSQEVADINDAPTGVTGTLSVHEFPTNGAAVGTLVGQDPDSGTFTYTLINNAGGRFAMDSSGHVTVADGLLLDFEQQNVHTIRVQVDDNEGGISQFDVNVSVTDVHGENVTGDNRGNMMVGGIESDTFHGANGNDILIGGGGIDYLFGDNGADRLDGGAGADVLTGGSDGDTFVFRKGEANGDVVMDFKGQGSGDDSIELIGYAAGTTFTRIGNGSSDVYQINDHGVIETVTIHGPGHVSATDVHFII